MFELFPKIFVFFVICSLLLPNPCPTYALPMDLGEDFSELVKEVKSLLSLVSWKGVERTRHNGIPTECSYDDDCLLGRVCLKQKCITGCRMNVNCPFSKSCVNGLCQNPCSIGGMCGVNTICTAEKHEALCSCLPGYTGDPLGECTRVYVECEVDRDCGNGYVCATQECKDINECLMERFPCGPGASCTNLPGWFRCSCPVPLVGDAYDPRGCRSPDSVCSHDFDCKSGRKCNPVTKKCLM